MFPEDDLPAIRACLFGIPQVPKHVILTPSESVFSALAAGAKHHQGWWLAARLGRSLACRIPQGSAAIDAVASLEVGTRVTFAGLCGSLRRAAVGEIRAAAEASWDGIQFPRTCQLLDKYRDATVTSVPSLSFAFGHASELARHADLVDLETAHVFRAAIQRGCPADAYLIVSDHVPDYPFYSPARQAVRLAVDELGRELRVLALGPG